MPFIAVRCPACGADIELDDSCEFGFCTYCGSKVMQDKVVVEHKGNVKIDNSEYVEKFLQNARRAKQKEDWDETEKYYNLVEQNDPTNIEAIFYSSYGKAKASLVESDLYKRQAAFKVLQNCVSIIDDNFQIEKADENEDIIKQISIDIIAMACSNYVYNQRKNGYGIVTWTDKMETVTLFNNLNAEFGTTLLNIIEKYPEEEKEKTVYLYELIAMHYRFMINNGSLTNKQIWVAKLREIDTKWHEVDPSHEIPDSETNQVSSGGSTGGCYIATAVYGSYDCPQVWTLRRYRDNILAATWYGRAFIKIYYAISPTLVKMFGKNKRFLNKCRSTLDQMVSDLQKNGVESTPYEDK